jgi:hypothetical protein
MSDINMEDLVEAPTSEAPAEETEETPEQDPLKTELERVQNKDPRKELEKAEKSLHFNAKRVAELGGDPTKVLGVSVEDSEDEDDKPVTIGMLKKIQRETAERTALQQADDIQNETERELVKHHLQNTIKSTGNPSEDLRNARALVNSLKNSQIIEEVSRRPEVKTHSNATGADAKQEKEVVLTPEEKQMMGAPFNMSVPEILAAREGKKFDFKSLKA